MMKRLSVKKVLIMVVLVGAASICLLFGLRMQKEVCAGVYVISLQQDNQVFSAADILNIENEGVDLTYIQQIYPDVSNGFRREEIPVYLTNENYAFFANSYVQEGAFFNSMQVSRELPVMVLNEAAAFQLFGNCKCVGETVYLNKKPYKIIGIMTEQGEKTAGIYLPYSTMKLLGISDLEVSQIWCIFPNLADVALVMKKVGYPLETLKVVQMNLVKKVFWQRFLVLMILLGIYVVLCICKSVRKKVMEFKKKQNLNKKHVYVGILQIIGICVGILWIWKLTEIVWCVPPSHELLRGNCQDVCYGIMDFYLLADLSIENMSFLPYWNLISIFSVLIFLYFFSLLVFGTVRKDVGYEKLEE